MVKSNHLNSFNVSSHCVIINVFVYLFFVINHSIDGYLFFAMYWLFDWPLKVSHHMIHPTLKLNSEQKMKIYDQTETSILACCGILMRQ